MNIYVETCPWKFHHYVSYLFCSYWNRMASKHRTPLKACSENQSLAPCHPVAALWRSQVFYFLRSLNILTPIGCYDVFPSSILQYSLPSMPFSWIPSAFQVSHSCTLTVPPLWSSRHCLRPFMVNRLTTFSSLLL
jgi:hypothetical protein